MRIIALCCVFAVLCVVVWATLAISLDRAEQVRRNRIAANGCESRAWCYKHLSK